jgi:enterochelin esterase-like enzyme
MTTSRRTFLTGALIGAGSALATAGWLVEQDVLPGRITIAKALGQDTPSAPAGVPQISIGPVKQGSFTSAARGGLATKWVIAYPPGTDPDKPTTAKGARLPVCVVLHGRGATSHDLLTLGYPNFLAAAVHAGLAPFALAAVDGRDRYWHARRNGEDPAKMVLDEWLPRLAEAGLAARPADRIGLLGWSMGGYGALLLASRLGAARVAVVAAESPALWLQPGDSAQGAFDDAEDFRANDVFKRQKVLSRIPIRIDCGTADPFHTAAKKFAAGLHPTPVTDLGAGNHSGTYWKAKAPKAIEFIGNRLTSA